MLDDLNREKYRQAEQELRSQRKRPRSQLTYIKEWVRHLKRSLGPKPNNWD